MSQPAIDISKLADLGDFGGSLSDRVYESLRGAILRLEFPPGAAMPKPVLCEQLGVSRTPVTEAIQRLEADGLVKVVPQSGTRVSRMSMREIREDAFMREALEVAAVEHAARKSSDAVVARLRRNLQMQASQVEDGDFEEFYLTDHAFHELIIECCGVARLKDAVRSVSNHIDRARHLLLPLPGRTSDSVAEHRAIFEAIRDSDPDAARRAMKHHLRQLLKRLEPLERDRPDLFSP